jgi:glyoxylase-like metal-dependent hydrolase (beta-lactamase superfamily II)
MSPQEVLPGVLHWRRVHPKIRIEVSSYYLTGGRVLIDPLLPEEGLEAFEPRPEHVLLTNRHHYRDSARFQERYGCTVWCVESGLHEFDSGKKVRGFRFGDTLPGNLEAVEIGVLCPDETALYMPDLKCLAVADGVVRHEDGPLTFVPDPYLGDDPQAVKAGLKRAYRALLDRDFDHLLPAHGHPRIGGARPALREFVES